MAITARKNKSERAGRTSSSRITLRGTSNRSNAVPMFRAKDVPPGGYKTKVEKVELVQTRVGADAVSVGYELKASNGRTLKAREVIPLDSWAFSLWCDAMIAAGLKADSDVEDAVGIEEELEVFYPSPNGLGQLRNRIPAAKAHSAVSTEEDDEEEDVGDFTVDDEDDDYLDID